MSASPIAALRQRFRDGLTVPLAEAEAALAKANRNAAHNVYLAQDAEWTRTQATALRRDDLDRQPLWGIPVSLKDCFDLAGFPTSCGSAFYREFHGLAAQDSTVAARVRTAGAVITGKTHLHQLAYGITGQNAEFGDCLQPRDAALLTGGSSSGAAASVQEGSALAAITRVSLPDRRWQSSPGVVKPLRHHRRKAEQKSGDHDEQGRPCHRHPPPHRAVANAHDDQRADRGQERDPASA